MRPAPTDEPAEIVDTPQPSTAGNGRATAAALAAGSALIAAAHLWGRWLQHQGRRMMVNAPPLTGNVDPRFGVRSLPALVVAAGAVGGADHVARTLPWRRLLWSSFAAALAWSVVLAAWDGIGGFTRSNASQVDYLQVLPLVDGVGDFLRKLLTDTGSLPSHVQAHPPGLVIALLGLERLGLATPVWLAVIEHVAAAASVPAVLLTARDVAGEGATRAAAPFVVFSSIALTWSSGDAIVLGAAAWSVALLVLATGCRGRRSDVLALGAGALASVAMFLSYGVALVAAVPLAVAWKRRRARPLVVALIPVSLVLILAGLGGFWWLDGLAVTRSAYVVGIARLRPYGYFLVANLAAAAIAVGPAAWAGVARLRDRAVWTLVGGALAAIAIADVSGLSKGEVERIWLPFLPWLVVGAGTSFEGESTAVRRWWLAVQVTWALLVQSVVYSPW